MSQATPTSTGATHRRTGLAFIAVALLVGATTICWRAAAAHAAPEDAGSIAGRVTDPDGNPLPGICVNVPNWSGAATDVDGLYQIDGVAAGDWTVQFVDCTATPIYITQWYNGQTDQNKADKVTVEADQTTEANAQLSPGVAVSGRVTGPGSEDGVAGINVNVNPYETNGPSAYAQTAADGTYRTGPLPDGTYRVQFSDGTGTWANQYWSGQPLWNNATKLPLSVAQGSEQRGIDAVLVAGATITGQVTDPDMVALGGICVSADTPDNGWYSTVAGTSTNPGDGTYTLTAVPSGLDLRLHFFPCSGPSPFVEEWYENATDPRQSTAIFLNGGEARHIDMRLRIGRTLLVLAAAATASACGAPRPVAACAPSATPKPLPSVERAGAPCAPPPAPPTPPLAAAPSVPTDMKVTAFDCSRVEDLAERSSARCVAGKSPIPAGIRGWHGGGGPFGSVWNADDLACNAELEVPCTGTFELSMKIGRTEVGHAKVEHAPPGVSCVVRLPRKRWEAELDRPGSLAYRSGVFRAEVWVACDDAPPDFFHAEDAFVAGFADGE